MQKQTGLSYDEMLFFDDEARNKNVEELGGCNVFGQRWSYKRRGGPRVKEWRRRKGGR
jgi:magnesium-dependent phosphatase 1